MRNFGLKPSVTWAPRREQEGVGSGVDNWGVVDNRNSHAICRMPERRKEATPARGRDGGRQGFSPGGSG